MWKSTLSHEEFPLPNSPARVYAYVAVRSTDMKRIAVNLTSTVITFAVGLTANSFWNWTSPVKNEPTVTRLTDIRKDNASFAPAVISAAADTSGREIVFGRGLRILPDEVHLMSERLRYDIDVSYPQIVGTDDPHIRRLNQHIKEIVREQYRWQLSPSKADLRYYKQKHPEAFNSIQLDYEVVLATDSLLSIYFIGYSYGIGAAHAVQYSFVINFDLISRKQLKLSDLFRRHSNYLNFISHYCEDGLSKTSEFIFDEALTPTAENFRSWNITTDGIRFNFDACEVFGCSEGKQTIEIPFTVLTPLLNPHALKHVH